MTARPLPPAFLREVVDALGPAAVVTDPDVVAGYAVDWTGRFRGDTPAVVRPRSADDVVAVVAACRAHGVALVPQGGNTGLVGGGVPLDGEVVLSLRSLVGVTVDRAAAQVSAGAGATLTAVKEAAVAAGWEYGIDLAARDSATIGGTVATNAGGVRVLRHGDTRAQLVGVEAVLGSGSLVRDLGGLLKDNTGYHLPSLLCGSEGTLAVLTTVRLRLVPAPRSRVTALLAFDELAPALDAALALRRGGVGLEAAELVFAEGVELVCSHTGAPWPFATRHDTLLLVEAAGSSDPSAGLAAAVGSLAGVADAAVATDTARRAELWHYREAHTEAVNRVGTPHKLDVTLPAGVLAQFVPAVRRLVAEVAPAAQCWLFGHAADGNLHVNVTGVDSDDETVDDAVLRLVAGLGGSISAEHGIGTAKKRWLSLRRSPAEIEAYRAVKRALDPDGILNPNVLLP